MRTIKPELAVLAPLAQARLTEIANERDEILKVFPHFKDIGAPKRERMNGNNWMEHPKNKAAIAAVANDAPTKKRGRRSWSAAQRKAASERMKARWRARKKSK